MGQITLDQVLQLCGIIEYGSVTTNRQAEKISSIDIKMTLKTSEQVDKLIDIMQGAKRPKTAQ